MKKDKSTSPCEASRSRAELKSLLMWCSLRNQIPPLPIKQHWVPDSNYSPAGRPRELNLPVTVPSEASQATLSTRVIKTGVMWYLAFVSTRREGLKSLKLWPS